MIKNYDNQEVKKFECSRVRGFEVLIDCPQEFWWFYCRTLGEKLNGVEPSNNCRTISNHFKLSNNLLCVLAPLREKIYK